jgi:anaerobic magnesium-protoporphyrin IX monomethyl ester cyclase
MKNNIDLVLVNPGGKKSIYQALSNVLAAVEPPVWAGLIASFVRRHGFTVHIIDANAEGLDNNQAAARIADLNPRLVAVVVYGHNPSASTQVMPAAGAVCASLKETIPETPVILVGGHVAALPERTLNEERSDYVCFSEGPYTILELLKVLKEGPLDFSSVRGLCYRENGKIIYTEPAPLVTNLDEMMPGIAWDLLPMSRYRAHNWHCFGGIPREPYATLYTTLGCPFHCSFCCIQAPFKTGERVSGYGEKVNSYRLWSPQSVIAELDILVGQYGVRNIKIADELFILNTSHVNSICDLIIERGYDLNIWAYARVDTLQDSMLEKLRKAGFRWLAIGIESASSRVRDDAAKGINSDDIISAVNRIREHGIYIGANYMFGLPEDNLNSMEETLALAMELNCEYANFSAVMAYPGSQLYDQALREGWKLPQSWGGYSQFAADATPLATRYLSGEDVLRFRDYAFQTYFTNPKYLEMMEKTFNAEAVSEIKEMTSVHLSR